MRKELGVLYLHNNTTQWQGFALEGVLGFLVCFLYLSASDPNRQLDPTRTDQSFSPGLAYGFVTVAGHLLAVSKLSLLPTIA